MRFAGNSCDIWANNSLLTDTKNLPVRNKDLFSLFLLWKKKRENHLYCVSESSITPSSHVGYILASVLVNIYMNAAVFMKKNRPGAYLRSDIPESYRMLGNVGGSGHSSDFRSRTS
jgi:hypothetical protein